MVLMWGAWGFFLSQAKQGDPGKPAMAADDFGQRLPATPRLQSVPGDDLTSYRAEQAAKLGGLAWVDQGAGTVRMPIKAAMRLIVTRADAFADQKAKVPEDHSWAFPGAAMMDGAGAPAVAPLPEHTSGAGARHRSAAAPGGPAAALGPMRIAALTIAALLTSASMAAAQGSMRLDHSLPSNEAPAILKNVDVVGHLNAQLPVDLTFRDETGRTVKVRDLLHEGRPVILVPAYYECPMLCTQVLNSLFTALGVVSLNPGKDFEVVVVSFDPKEPYGLARDKKAAYMAKYKRPGTESGFHFLTGDQDVDRAAARHRRLQVPVRPGHRSVRAPGDDRRADAGRSHLEVLPRHRLLGARSPLRADRSVGGPRRLDVRAQGDHVVLQLRPHHGHLRPPDDASGAGGRHRLHRRAC